MVLMNLSLLYQNANFQMQFCDILLQSRPRKQMKTLSPNTPITAQLFSTKHVRQPTRTLHGRTTHCAHHTRYRNAVSLEISRCSTSTALQKSQRLVKRSRFHTFTVTFETPYIIQFQKSSRMCENVIVSPALHFRLFQLFRVCAQRSDVVT